jgi:hypothetical protein
LLRPYGKPCRAVPRSRTQTRGSGSWVRVSSPPYWVVSAWAGGYCRVPHSSSWCSFCGIVRLLPDGCVGKVARTPLGRRAGDVPNERSRPRSMPDRWAAGKDGSESVGHGAPARRRGDEVAQLQLRADVCGLPRGSAVVVVTGSETSPASSVLSGHDFFVPAIYVVQDVAGETGCVDDALDIATCLDQPIRKGVAGPDGRFP